ncbi:MAG: hypothetical protein VXW65_02850 [Pseudomonadota bacterium]|nr:hypothetical protein [Pseudomonadota bacterium]
MALELGRDFSKRWLAAPEVVRQHVYAELRSICTLVEPETDFAEWQQQQAQLPSLDLIIQTAQAEAQAAPRQTTPSGSPHQQLAVDLKKRFLREADDLIEQALDPIRQQLRGWLQAEMQRLLAEQQHTTETSPPNTH